MFAYECVPNVSCGRNPKLIAAITALLRDSDGCHLIHVDSGYDADRTVFTLVGSAEGLLNAMTCLYCEVLKLVDMQQYRGNHPAVGAVDVCPFVPLSSEGSIEVCKSLAIELAQRVGSDLAIPVYLYRESATSAQREELANIRRGGLAGLSRRIEEAAWKPDFGPSQLHPSFGATIIGARPVLIAFNVNLKSGDLGLAKRIAAQIREASASPHALPFCRSLGWKLESSGLVQVSNNLYDYNATGLHTVYEKVRELAFGEGANVTGSELIGLVPEAALRAAGKYYLERWNPVVSNPSNREICETAIQTLNLHDISPFKMEDRVIEYLTAK